MSHGDQHRLPVEPSAEILAEVERRLSVRLDASSARTGAWGESWGAPTDRGSWVKVDSRTPRTIQSQSWVGPEAASTVTGVPMPRWWATVTWRDDSADRVWRAVEMDRVAEPPLACDGAVLTADPGLFDEWWARLRAALATLAGHRTLRVCGRQELVTRRLAAAFGGGFDMTVHEWTTAHGDLHWGNVCGPDRLSLLDWADWGLAPRGTDAACLWATALGVPTVAERVLDEFRDDLECRSGRLTRLWALSNLIRMDGRRADATRLASAARAAADELLTTF